MPPAILCAEAPSPLEIKLTLSEGLGPLTEAESLSHRCDLADLDEGTALCLANFGDLDGHSTGAASAYGGPPCPEDRWYQVFVSAVWLDVACAWFEPHRSNVNQAAPTASQV